MENSLNQSRFSGVQQPGAQGKNPFSGQVSQAASTIGGDTSHLKGKIVSLEVSKNKKYNT